MGREVGRMEWVVGARFRRKKGSLPLGGKESKQTHPNHQPNRSSTARWRKETTVFTVASTVRATWGRRVQSIRRAASMPRDSRCSIPPNSEPWGKTTPRSVGDLLQIARNTLQEFAAAGDLYATDSLKT